MPRSGCRSYKRECRACFVNDHPNRYSVISSCDNYRLFMKSSAKIQSEWHVSNLIVHLQWVHKYDQHPLNPDISSLPWVKYLCKKQKVVNIFQRCVYWCHIFLTSCPFHQVNVEFWSLTHLFRKCIFVQTHNTCLWLVNNCARLASAVIYLKLPKNILKISR